MLLVAASCFARTVRFATYSMPYFTEDMTRDAAYNKYRRTLIADIAAREDWTVVFVDSVYEGRENCRGDSEILRNGEVDVLCTARKRQDRAPGELWNGNGGEGAADTDYISEKPLYIEYDVVVARDEDRRFINGDLAALNGAKVGCYGEAGKGLAARFASLCGGEGAQIIVQDCVSAEKMERDTQQGAVDLCIMGVHDIPRGFKSVYMLGATPVYFIARDVAVKEEIDSAMNAIEKENPFYMAEMMKWSGGGGSLNVNNFSKEEIAFVKYVREKRNVVVTVHSKSEPFSDIDSVGNFTGLDASIWQAVSLISGLDFVYIDADKYKRQDEIDYIRMVNANGWRTHNDYKRFTPAIMTRHEQVYARPGFDVKSVLRSKEGTACGTGKDGAIVIAMINEQRILLPFLDRWFKEYEISVCNSLRECLENASDGTVDVAMVDETFLRSMHNINEYPRLAQRAPLMMDVPVSIEIKGPHSAIITSILNKALTQIPFEYFERENINAELEMGYVPSRHTILSHSVANVIVFASLLGIALLTVSMYSSYRYKIRSETDEITLFPNLGKFQFLAQRMLDTPTQNGGFVLTSICVLGFRHLNNTFGYEWGRQLLVIIADCLRKTESNAPSVMTHGYDDIFYCLFEYTDKDRATYFINNEVAVINEALLKAGYHVIVKSSAVYLETGQTWSPTRSKESIQSMMDKADYARESVSSDRMQLGKKGNFAVFDTRLAEERENETRIERRVVNAFSNNEIKAVYQPKIDLRTGRLEGAEAFARWQSPDMGLVMPNMFLPVFEKNGYSLRFNFHMYATVLSFLQSLIDRGNAPVPISMNVTYLNINSDAFVRKFEEVFSRFSVPRSLIELELSERSSGMTNNELRRMSRLLHEGGFSVAIDDFGTGESSLALLGSVSADVIKFDQRLLSESDTSNGSRIILTKLIEMAHLLGRKVVCKCVEKKSQVEFLRSIDCDVVQGFYYSPALSGEDFRAYMETSL